jgi:uncharacterized membrane protein YraQ (UPF0718 family)
MNLFIAFWETTLAMAPWLLFGFLAAGLLSLFFSPERISATLGRNAGKKAIWLSVLLGVPLPLCSCGVLPTALGLRKSGASKGATAAFLISTPQTGIDSFFATGSLLGWVFAIIRPLVAILTGLVGGIVVDSIDHEPQIQTTTAKTLSTTNQNLWNKSRAILQYGYGMLLGNVAWALLIGIIISALISILIPNDFFNNTFLGNDWVAFPVMLLIGIPMYVCSTASIPVALSLMAKGISPGAALIFLIVGPALNGASLTILLRLLGKTCTLIHLAIISSFALLAGLCLNLINTHWNLLPTYTTCNCATHNTPLWQKVAAGLLLLLLAFHITKKILTKVRPMNTNTPTQASRIVIKGMMCDHCRNAAQKLLTSYPTVTNVERCAPDAFLVQGSLPDTLAKDIEDLGFTLLQNTQNQE